MINRLTQFIKNIQKYMSEKNTDIHIFNTLFMSLEEAEKINRKKPDVYGLTQSVVSKIMNGNMDVPKLYLNAAKKISPSDISEDIEKDISKYINDDDKKRLTKELVELIVKDDYFSDEEKNDISQCCIEHDFSLLISNVFILLLRKIESDKQINAQLSLHCYYQGKIYNSLKVEEIRHDIEDHADNKKKEINVLFQKINSTHIPTIKEKRGNIIYPNNKMVELYKALDSLNTKCEVSDSIKGYINYYSSHFDIEMADDFYDLGKLKECRIKIPGQNPSISGTSLEKQKYKLIMELYWNVLDLCYLADYYKELNFSHCLKIALENSSCYEDKDIIVKILLPKGSLYNYCDYSFDNNDSANLFISLYKKYFEIKETVDYELYSNSRSFIPEIPVQQFSSPFSANVVDKDIVEANKYYNNLQAYEVIEDSEYDIVKIEIEKIRKNSVVLFACPILILKDISKIEYIIKSNNIVGEKRTTIKK